MTTTSSTASDAPGTVTPPASASDAATTTAATGDGSAAAQDAGSTSTTTDAAQAGAGGAAASADAGAQGAAASTEPAPITLTLSEDSPLDATATERLVAFSRERGLTQEAAQGVVGFLEQEIAERDAAFRAAHEPGGAVWEQQQTTWKEQALADPEIGGTPEQLAANVAVAGKVLDEYAPPAVRELLQTTGLGSNPDAVRMFVKIGRALSENGKFVMPGPGATERRPSGWFPSMQQQDGEG